MGPRSGLVGAVWSVFERWVRRELNRFVRLCRGRGLGGLKQRCVGPATLILVQGHNSGGDARISDPFSVIKLPVPSSCGIFVGENKWLNQGTVLLHGGEDEAGENIIPFCAPVKSPGATEPTPWLPEVGIPFPGGFLLLWSLL